MCDRRHMVLRNRFTPAQLSSDSGWIMASVPQRPFSRHDGTTKWRVMMSTGLVYVPEKGAMGDLTSRCGQWFTAGDGPGARSPASASSLMSREQSARRVRPGKIDHRVERARGAT